MSDGVAQVHHERVEVVGEALGRGGEPVLVAPSPRPMRSRLRVCRSRKGSRVPRLTAKSTRSAFSVNPDATWTPAFGPSLPDRDERRIQEQDDEPDVVEVAAPLL